MGKSSEYAETAKHFARLLVEKQFALVYGGGNVGLMGVVADEVIRCGGTAVGVIPQKLVDYEVAHTELHEMHIVETMHQRKALMCEYASGFAILPGAVGTLEELFEIIVLNQLNYIDKPIAFLNTNSFYDKLFEFLEYLISEGFMKKETYDMLYKSDKAEEVVSYLESKIKP